MAETETVRLHMPADEGGPNDVVEVSPARARQLVDRAGVAERVGTTTEQAAQTDDRTTLEALTVEDLRDRAAAAGIEGRSSMTKAQLVDALLSSSSS